MGQPWVWVGDLVLMPQQGELGTESARCRHNSEEPGTSAVGGRGSAGHTCPLPTWIVSTASGEGMFLKVAAAGLRLTLNLLEQISRGGAPASVP